MDVSDAAKVLQGLVAGVGQLVAGGPVLAEADVGLDLDDEANRERRLVVIAIAIAVQTCRA